MHAMKIGIASQTKTKLELFVSITCLIYVNFLMTNSALNFLSNIDISCMKRRNKILSKIY